MGSNYQPVFTQELNDSKPAGDFLIILIGFIHHQ